MSDLYVIKKTTLEAIGDIIREKEKTTDPILVSEMVERLRAIITNLETIEDALATNSLTEYSNDRIMYLEGYAFYRRSNLTTINLPAILGIGSYAFYQCIGLTTVNMPLLRNINAYAFYSCTQLPIVDFPEASKLSMYAFHGCTVLSTVILRRETLVTLDNVNVFTDTPIASGTGYIYVPSALVEEYKAATNWSTYADQIRAIEDYPDITGG